MSANSSDKQGAKAPKEKKHIAHKLRVPRSRWWLVLAFPGWVLAGFGLSNVIIRGIVETLVGLGVPLASVNKSILSFTLAACVYVLSVAIVVGIPWWARKYKTSKQDVGLTRLPSWMDILLAPAGGVVYLACSIALLAFVKAYIPGVDLEQVQNTGFSNLNYQYEVVFAFITLIVIAPIFEEVLFRGYLYGKLRKLVPVWAAILIVSAVFAAVHGQWNVALDVFVLSVVLCGLREMTGSIWAGILLHMCKNGLAFYFLFINPVLLRTMGG